jgi:hypothetical protein
MPRLLPNPGRLTLKSTTETLVRWFLHGRRRKFLRFTPAVRMMVDMKNVPWTMARKFVADRLSSIASQTAVRLTGVVAEHAYSSIL